MEKQGQMAGGPGPSRPLVWQSRLANGTPIPGKMGSLTPASTRQVEPAESPAGEGHDKVCVKIGVLGDAQTGKTSLVVSYVESEVTDDYVQTLGVNCMEKGFTLASVQLDLSIWDLGGHRQFMSMLPLVCNDASAILFVFDLTRHSTLQSVRQWYLQARLVNKYALPVLVGTKYDEFVGLPEEAQQMMTDQALRYAQALDAPLFFSSIPYNINVHKVFKVVLACLFDLPCPVPQTVSVGEPIVSF